MKVKIKTWEAMEKEFGLYDDGDIPCAFGFLECMEQALPEDRVIDVRVDIGQDSTGTVYRCDAIEQLRHLWFSDDMIEEIITEEK